MPSLNLIRAGLRRRHILAATAAAWAPAVHAALAPVIVASKIDTEGAVLGSLMAAALRQNGIAVETRLQLGPTRILRQALLAGAIDLYPEYTGDGAGFFHREGDPVWHDPAHAYATIRALDLAANRLVWLPPAPAANGWGVAVGRSLPNLKTLADLARHVNAGGFLRLAASVEFAESPDALPAFERAYGFRLDQDQLLLLAGGNTAATLRAAAENISGVNAAMAYGTDGALDTLRLALLSDPARAGIVYQPAAVIRQAALEAHPGIAPALAPVFAALDVPTLRRLNARVAVNGDDPAAVAAAFLAGATR